MNIKLTNHAYHRARERCPRLFASGVSQGKKKLRELAAEAVEFGDLITTWKARNGHDGLVGKYRLASLVFTISERNELISVGTARWTETSTRETTP